MTGNAVPGVPTGPYTVNDQTVITDDFTHGSATISITTATGKSFRMTGLTIVSGTSAAAFNGIVAVYGTSQSVRIDHNHFNAPRDGDHVVQFNTWTYGVVDHNEFDNGGNVFFLEFYSGGWYGLPDPNNYGQASWAVSENFGTNQFTYVENNYFAGGFAQDCNYGGRYVLRYNLVGYGSKLEIHGPSGSFPFRGCRAYELYGNTFDYVASPTASNAFAFVVQMESGTGLWWRNSITGYYQFLHADVVRTNNSTYAEPATPSGWGYCSATPVAGVLGPSPWDGNLPGQNGRPCLDGVGRGKGDLLTGAAFPNIVDSVTSTITWPNQASVPLYAWMNVFNPVPDSSSQYFAADAVTVENSDYYLELPNYNENTSFNGTVEYGLWALIGETIYLHSPCCLVGNRQQSTRLLLRGKHLEYCNFNACVLRALHVSASARHRKPNFRSAFRSNESRRHGKLIRSLDVFRSQLHPRRGVFQNTSIDRSAQEASTVVNSSAATQFFSNNPRRQSLV